MNTRHRILREHSAAREKAEALLRGLLDARASTRRALGDAARPVGSGVSRGLESAIASTRRLIETYTRTLDALHRDLSDDDLRFLDEVERDSATSP
jgi:hypothetical protein